MQNAVNDILKTINFRQTTDWNVKRIASHFAETYKYNRIPIGRCIERIKENVTVNDRTMYKRLTIKTKGEGVCVRDEIKGKEIKTKKQYRVTAGQLAVSKIDARNGAFGIVPEKASGAIITGNFWVFHINTSIVLPQYLVLILSSEQFVQAWLECSNGSGNRLYLQEQKFLDYEIPVPDLDIQARIVSSYEESLNQAKQLIIEANNQEEKIFDYIKKELQIKDTENKKKENVLQQIKYSSMVKWGATENLDAVSPKELFVSSKYDNVPLKTISTINPSVSFPADLPENEVSFLPMECISDVFGEISEQRLGHISDSSGYTRFQENDVLWAKITPCMQNGKCAIARYLINGYGYGSTEFHVIRANIEKVLPEYVYCFLRSKRLRHAAKAYFSGSAGQQRVGAEFLEALTIPLIPISTQDQKTLSQEKLVSQVFLIKKEIKELRRKSQHLLDSAKSEFETTVFGN